jgi:nucleoside-diphosphate-sugar epimerase
MNWRNTDKPILITGGGGFLGKIICSNIGNIKSIGKSDFNDFKSDLSLEVPQVNEGYELIIHTAGLAHNKFTKHVKDKYLHFYNQNCISTKNLLKGLEQSSSLPKSFVYISSVAVYGLNSGKNINEEHPLNANDPYGLSKIQAESIVQEWCTKNNVICTILRLPLLVGENPPGNLGAMIKGIIKGYYFNIAGGLAKKSMVMAEDVVQAILPASKIGGIYHLTDGYHPSFKELSFHIANQLQKKKPKNIPTFIAIFLGQIGDLLGKKAPFSTYKLSKITSDLTFDDSKARNAFGWSPNKVLDVFEINGSL